MDNDETSIRPRENPYDVGHLPVSGEYGSRRKRALPDPGVWQELEDKQQDDEIDYYFE